MPKGEQAPKTNHLRKVKTAHEKQNSKEGQKAQMSPILIYPHHCTNVFGFIFFEQSTQKLQ